MVASQIASDQSSLSRLRRYGWETFAVLSGILIAFGLDAGWSAYRESAALRETLAVLHQEFSDTQIQLDTVLVVNHLAIEASSVFLRMTVDDLADLGEDSAGIVVQGLLRSYTFDPANAALSALISVNLLENVRDPALRTRLAAWSGLVDDLREEQSEVRRNEAVMRDEWATLGLWVAPLQGPQLPDSMREKYSRGGLSPDYSPRDFLRLLMTHDRARQQVALRRRGIVLMLAEQEGVSAAAVTILRLLRDAS